MEFRDLIKALGEKCTRMKTSILTEEATKTAMVLPFLREMGYDVFNPAEISPEYITDVGIKKGEKIDYAIMNNGTPVVLIECKHHAQVLDLHDGQLLRYFHVSKAKFGILTNGINYRFYTDLVESNKMDSKPFFEFNITEIRDNQIEELKKFHKSSFNVTSIFNTASDLKYIGEIRHQLAAEILNPSEAMIRVFAKQIYAGVITQKVLDQFQRLTKMAFSQYLSDMITDRLQAAINNQAEDQKKMDAQIAPLSVEAKVETTEDEQESIRIIKAIVSRDIDPERVSLRDAQSYCAILLDDNNRKTLARLYYSNKRKFICLMDENKKEIRHELEKVSDIYKYTTQLLGVLSLLEKGRQTS